MLATSFTEILEIDDAGNESRLQKISCPRTADRVNTEVSEEDASVSKLERLICETTWSAVPAGRQEI